MPGQLALQLARGKKQRWILKPTSCPTAQVSLIVEEAGSRRQVGQWLDQLASRHKGRLLVGVLVIIVQLTSFELSKVFINPFSGTGRAERRWEQVEYLFPASDGVHLQMMMLASR